MNKKQIDWTITLLPLIIVVVLSVLFFFMPEQSNAVISQIRFFFGDTFGTYYLIIGLGVIFLSLVSMFYIQRQKKDSSEQNQN